MATNDIILKGIAWTTGPLCGVQKPIRPLDRRLESLVPLGTTGRGPSDSPKHIAESRQQPSPRRFGQSLEYGLHGKNRMQPMGCMSSI